MTYENSNENDENEVNEPATVEHKNEDEKIAKNEDKPVDANATSEAMPVITEEELEI